MNDQKPEKPVVSSDRIELHSVFHTIQGEGPFSGRRAVFVRLAGCNLQCPLCDTEYTANRRVLTAFDVAGRVDEVAQEHRTKLVVITGGEPFRQNLTELLGTLVYHDYTVQVETNGTLPLSASDHRFEYSRDMHLAHSVNGVFIVCSPKTGRIHPSIERYACAYKYVMRAGDVSPEDGLPLRALDHPAKPHLARPPSVLWPRPVYIQPADEGDATRNAANLQACVESCISFGHVLQLQVHKHIGMP